MPDLQILRQMIKDDAMVPLPATSSKHTVKLVEPQAPGSSVTICGLPNDSVVIKADFFSPPSSVFRGSKGECRRSDFVILADSGNQKVILYIEITSSRKPRPEVVQQLKGAQCFVAYCQQIGKAFWNCGSFLDDYSPRFVFVAHTSISKTKTRSSSNLVLHDRPDQMLTITSPHRLQFRHLAGTR